MSQRPRVAIVHDYLTQRGGAERVALLMARAFPEATLHTSLYEPDLTFPEFKDIEVRTLALNHVPLFRRDHRLAFPLLAPSFSAHRVDADVVLCSSSGWSHGVRTTGRKIVYCYAPARWLYQTDRYLGLHSADRPSSASSAAFGALKQRIARASLSILKQPLLGWDRRASRSAETYLTSSSAMANAIMDAYGIRAEVVPPPSPLEPRGEMRSLDGIDPGYFVCVARLLPYKNVDVVVEAMNLLPENRLIVVGDGELRAELERSAPENVIFAGRLDDATLRWVYANSVALVSASFEDYGLTPLEAAGFGKPSVVLRAGGFLDTVLDEKTGVFFDRPESSEVAAAMTKATTIRWDHDVLSAQADAYSIATFTQRLQEIVAHHLR